MPYASRFLVAALAASFGLNLLACTRDEPATFLPKSGTWSYEEDALVSNSCGDALNSIVRSPSFTLDYDEGDEFQIELGAADAVCEIDGTEFSCADYELEPTEVAALDVTLYSAVTWEGEFSSDSVATGHEILAVTCVGDNCTLLDTLPCTRDSTFTAEFLN